MSEDLEKLSAFFEEKIDPMDELPYRPDQEEKESWFSGRLLS